MSKRRNRLRSVTYSLPIKVPKMDPVAGPMKDPETGEPLFITHDFAVCLAYTKENVLHEINLVIRGKSGQGMDLIMTELGIGLSRAIQGRDPETGAEVP